MWCTCLSEQALVEESILFLPWAARAASCWKLLAVWPLKDHHQACIWRSELDLRHHLQGQSLLMLLIATILV